MTTTPPKGHLMTNTEPTAVSCYTVPPNMADYEPATEMEVAMKTALLQYIELAKTQRQYITQVTQQRDDWQRRAQHLAGPLSVVSTDPEEGPEA